MAEYGHGNHWDWGRPGLSKASSPGPFCFTNLINRCNTLSAPNNRMFAHEESTNWYKIGTIALGVAIAGVVGGIIVSGQFNYQVVGIGVLIVFALLGILSVLLYFLPLIVALYRNHPQVGPIAVINILFGWTFIGWVVAFAWCVSNIKQNE